MVEDVTIEEARLNLYLNGKKAISMMTIPKRPRCICNWFFNE